MFRLVKGLSPMGFSEGFEAGRWFVGIWLTAMLLCINAPLFLIYGFSGLLIFANTIPKSSSETSLLQSGSVNISASSEMFASY